MSLDFDVIIIGAGAAGLTATARLQHAGLNVICLEARDRIGGRIFTYRDPLCPVPIELGAEFVHGSPPETLAIAEQAGLILCDVASTMCTLHNAIWTSDESENPMWEIFDRLGDPGPDESWASFLSHTDASDEAKRRATRYVEGFNAAYADRISVASIAQDNRASAAIDQGHQSRVLNGYSEILHNLAQLCTTRLNHVVETVTWGRGSVSLAVQARVPIQARAAIVTLPIGVLHHGDVHFSPVPPALTEAAPHIANGQVFRVTLQFHERFWERIDGLRDAAFLFTEDAVFPTWWSSLPVRAPLLTGWSAGPHTATLIGPLPLRSRQRSNRLPHSRHRPRPARSSAFLAPSRLAIRPLLPWRLQLRARRTPGRPSPARRTHRRHALLRRRSHRNSRPQRHRSWSHRHRRARGPASPRRPPLSWQ